VVVVAFWFGYPSLGMMQPDSKVAQTEQQQDND
jgi:hypothetical protein